MAGDCSKRSFLFKSQVIQPFLGGMRRCQCSKKERPHIIGQDTPLFSRFIHETSLTRRYHHRSTQHASDHHQTMHWGQLKLLISEIEFLTPFFGEVFHVVYAGAAPGIHIPILSMMFPSMHFILVDPLASVIADGEYWNIKVMQVHMTDELAQTFASQFQSDQLLFISDVRVGTNKRSPHHESDKAHQKRIKKDMDDQKKWVKIMSPLSSMLKFRLPWDDSIEGKGGTLYPKGNIHLPVYGRSMTHETRLVVEKGAVDVSYDNKLYEGQMAYFNQVLRPALYPAGPREHRCYDCVAFHAIVKQYMMKSGIHIPKSNGYEFVKDKCWYIEKWLLRCMEKWYKTDNQHLLALVILGMLTAEELQILLTPWL